ncbi:MAG: hypothetical protein WAX04_06635, partial [Oscillospiraceae bacterium]
MYSNILDSIYTQAHQKIKAENYLFESLLYGFHPVLSSNQAIDSSVILSLVENQTSKSAFLNLIKQGYIRFSLYGNASNIQSFFMDRLRLCLSDQNSTFLFSSLPFLNEFQYSDQERRHIYSAMFKQISEQSTKIGIIINREHKEYLENYVHIIMEINKAIGGYITAANPTKNLSALLKSKAAAQLVELDEEEAVYKDTLSDLIHKINTERRSDYYILIDKYKNENNVPEPIID